MRTITNSPWADWCFLRDIQVDRCDVWRVSLHQELGRPSLDGNSTYDNIEDSLNDESRNGRSWAWWYKLSQDFAFTLGTQETIGCWPRPDQEWEPLAFRRLFVQDSEDVLELCPNELHIVWKHRNRLCGSVAAAAEVYAFLRLQQGIDEYYNGYQQFLMLDEVLEAGSLLTRIEELEDYYEPNESNINHVNIVENQISGDVSTWIAKDTPSQATIEGVAVRSAQNKPFFSKNQEEAVDFDDELILSEDDIVHMSTESLQTAWNRRKHAFTDLRAAAATLARLKFENRSDPILRPTEDYLKHELIQQLSDYLPDGSHSVSENKKEKSNGDIRIERMKKDPESVTSPRRTDHPVGDCASNIA